MIDIQDKSRCCGCGACLNACRFDAICFEEDELGFVFPKVDSSKCVGCGQCEAVCPMLNVCEKKDVQETFAVVLKNKEALCSSASGGAFYALARTFLEEGGIVYGCAFDESTTPICRRVETLKELSSLQGSKYVQSDMGLSFLSIKEDLHTGRSVLFSGTPCQVAAVRSFLGNEASENLTTVDLVCHGVPSRRLWKDYVDVLEKQAKGKLVSFVFRSKMSSSSFCAKAVFLTQRRKRLTRIFPSSLSSYYYYFLRGAVYRQSCYSCPFAANMRCSDLTISDFWGYPSQRLDRRMGISAVLVMTNKGGSLFEKSSRYLEFEQRTFEEAANYNAQLSEPVSKEKFAPEILEYWKNCGMESLERRFLRKHWKAWILYRSFLGKIYLFLKRYGKKN